jgi:hypothetical protein
MESALLVFGPASAVENVSTNGKATVRLAGTSIDDILRNRSQVENKSVEALVQQGSIVAKLSLVPPPNVELRQAGQPGAATDVQVKFSFERQEDVEKRGEFSVDVIKPAWLESKWHRTRGLPDKIPVILYVSLDTQSAWPDAVSPYIDLSGIRENDPRVKVSEDGSRRVLVIPGQELGVSLRIDKSRLKAVLQPGVTESRYVDINGDVTIEWEE